LASHHTYTLSLHDALPICAEIAKQLGFRSANAAEEHLKALARKGVIEIVSGTSRGIRLIGEVEAANDEQEGLPLVGRVAAGEPRSEEHTSELQSRFDLVCR